MREEREGSPSTRHKKKRTDASPRECGKQFFAAVDPFLSSPTMETSSVEREDG